MNILGIETSCDETAASVVTDGVWVLRFLFEGTSSLPCVDAADMDGNGNLEVTDAINVPA